MHSSTDYKKKGGRPKGLPKTGGRKPGVLNKKSYWLRDELERVGFDWADDFKDTMQLCDYDRARILIDMLPYLNAKIEPRKIDDENENSTDSDSPINIGSVVNE